MEVVSEEDEGGKAGRTDGVGFCDSLRCVSNRVERIGHVANLFREVGHFGNTARIIRDGAKGIDGHDNSRKRQHGHGRDGNPVQFTKCIGRQDTNNDGLAYFIFTAPNTAGDDTLTVQALGQTGITVVTVQ